MFHRGIRLTTAVSWVPPAACKDRGESRKMSRGGIQYQGLYFRGGDFNPVFWGPRAHPGKRDEFTTDGRSDE
jgi:hypothetical protein